MVNVSDEFIRSTAKDYDMEVEEVREIFMITKNEKTMYPDLEAFIKNRAEQNNP